MKRIVAAALLLLSGCNRAVSEAERRYEVADKAGSAKAKCDAAQDVMSAYQTAGDADGYRKWKETADQQCAMARLEALQADHTYP